tara:strand:- start:767 stop:1297 length:531 start_codon:yes stop_codon:yes gene_type:complete
MKKISLNLVSLLTVLFLTNCAATSPPGWFSNVKCKKDYICGVGVAEGNRLQMAIAEAEQNARLQIGQNINSNVQGLIRQASEEINDRSAINNFQLMAESVFDIQLKDTKMEKQDIKTKRGGMHTVYVSMSYDESKANDRLLRQIEEDKKLYDAFRTTQLYDNMQKKVEAYRARNSN